MRTFLTISLTVAAIICGVALAQQANNTALPKEATYISEEKLQSIMQGAPADPKTGKPGSFSARLLNAGPSSTAFIRLDEPDQPHAHGTASEVLIIKSGSAIMQTGGTITGDVKPGSAVHKQIFVNPGDPGVRTGGNPGGQGQGQGQNKAPGAGRQGGGGVPGDISGSAIEGGTKQRVKAGDIIFIPALVAHTFLQVDEPVVYLDIKFPRADADVKYSSTDVPKAQ
jgi:mannose-6-phosphate isomerase-like protein (cupin superfamily)